MSGKNLTVIAKIVAKPDTIETVKQELLALVAPSRTDEGCVNYDLHQSIDDPAVFVFHENWTSKAMLESHLQTPHLSAFAAKAGGLLAQPLEIIQCEMIGEPA